MPLSIHLSPVGEFGDVTRHRWQAGSAPGISNRGRPPIRDPRPLTGPRRLLRTSFTVSSLICEGSGMVSGPDWIRGTGCSEPARLRFETEQGAGDYRQPMSKDTRERLEYSAKAGPGDRVAALSSPGSCSTPGRGCRSGLLPGGICHLRRRLAVHAGSGLSIPGVPPSA